jgi:GNAT superfamily N-acetyltransferase
LTLLTVGPLGPADDAIEEWSELFCAAVEAASGSVLSPSAVAARIRGEGNGTKHWVARLDDEIVGIAETRLQGDVTFVRLYVAPPFRRRGVGRAILRVLRADSEAPRLRATTNVGEAGEEFALSCGARVVMQLVVMSQPLGEIALVEVPPEGYELIVWRGGAPETLLRSYAQAKRHIADAPNAQEQLQVDPAWDEARVREWERSFRANGQTLWVCAALFEGAVVAFTELAVGSSPAVDQHDTAVLPLHRGAGLAGAVKSHLARALRAERPDVTSVSSTINAEHTAMITVNEKLGYRIVRERLLVEVPADVAR